MNYKKHYDLLIERARERILDSYTESHHIIPRCIGGNDDLSNIVELTPEEHFVAHQLLVKMYPDNYKLVSAVVIMSGRKVGRQCNNKLYGWLKKRHAMTRAPHSIETKLKMSISHTGKQHSDETRNKISRSQIGQSRPPMPDKTREALCKANIGRAPTNKGIPRSEETKRKIVSTMATVYESKRGIAMPVIICPHCGKSGNRIVMPRWHFDNCKNYS
jgi:hypothetical protein